MPSGSTAQPEPQRIVETVCAQARAVLEVLASPLGYDRALAGLAAVERRLGEARAPLPRAVAEVRVAAGLLRAAIETHLESHSADDYRTVIARRDALRDACMDAALGPPTARPESRPRPVPAATAR